MRSAIEWRPLLGWALLYFVLQLTVIGGIIALSHVFAATPYSGNCDRNGDGYVYATDLALIVRDGGDVNKDGVTNSADLGLCAAAYGAYTRLADCACANPEGDVATIEAMTPEPCTSGLTIEFATQTAIAFSEWPTPQPCDLTQP